MAQGGGPLICLCKRKRIGRDIRGAKHEGDDEKLFKTLQRRHQRKEGSLKEAGMVLLPRKPTHIPAQNLVDHNSLRPCSQVHLRATHFRGQALVSIRHLRRKFEIPRLSNDNEDTTVSPSQSIPSNRFP